MTDSTRHATRMVRKKAVIDAAIAQADQEKGLLLVLTGNGKGKSSSAFGMVARFNPVDADGCASIMEASFDATMRA